MNTVGPYHNRQETYGYFTLPFCIGSKETISHYHETLSDALQGVELEFSGMEIDFKGNFLFALFRTNILYILIKSLEGEKLLDIQTNFIPVHK